MIVHILLIILVLLFAFSPPKEKKKGIVICGLFLFIILAFKGFDVGKDTPDYLDEYKYATKVVEFNNEEFEPARPMFLSACKALGLSARGYLIIVALFTCIPLLKFIKRNSIIPCFTLLLYITIGNYTFNLTGIRQTLASSIVIAGLYLALKNPSVIKRVLIVLISVLIAQLMHKSSLFCVTFIPLLFVKNVGKKTVAAMAVLPLIMLLLKSSVANLFLNFLIGKYESYGDYEADPSFVAYFVIPYVIFLYSTYLYLLWKKKNEFNKDSCNDRMLLFCYLCAGLYATIAGASMSFPIATRFIYYVSLPTLVFISNFVVLAPLAKDMRKLQMYGIAFICILFFIISTTGGILAIDNYHFGLW